MKISRKHALWAGTFLSIAGPLFVSGQAFAGEAEDQAGASVQEAAPSDAPGTGIADIIVTARRRAESLQNVPMTVNALDAKALATKQIANAYDLGATTPGVTARNTSHNPGFFIRGQGVPNFAGSSSVITYYNDVPIVENKVTGGSMLTFYDLESIQVLKGAQGTLFGRTSTAGAVLIQSKAPTNEFDGFGEVKYGNLDTTNITAAINVPLINDVLAIRVAGNYDYSRGYTFNRSNGQYLDGTDRSSFRVSVKFTPTSWLTNMFVFTDLNMKESYSGAVPWHLETDNSLLDTRVGRTGYNAVAGLCGFLYSADPASQVQCMTIRLGLINAAASSVQSDVATGSSRSLSSDRYSLIKWHPQQIINTTRVELGSHGLFQDLAFKNILQTSRFLSSSRDISCCSGDPSLISVQTGLDYVNGRFVDNNAGRTPWFGRWSNEAQLSTRLGGKHDFLIGYYYETQDRSDYSPDRADPYVILNGALNPAFTTLGQPILDPTGLPQINQSPISNYRMTQKGIFTQLTLDLGEFGLEGLRLTGGYRHSSASERATVTPSNFLFSGTPGNYTAVLLPGTPATGVYKDSKDSYTVSLDYRLSRSVMLYAVHHHGFKPGGLNLQALPVDKTLFPNIHDTYPAESVDDYEIGAKTDWSVGGVDGRTNISLFQSDFSNLQKSFTRAGPNGSPVGQIEAAADLRVRGVEFETNLRLSDMFRVDFNYAFTDAEYTRFPGTIIRPADGVVLNNIDTPVSSTPKHAFSLAPEMTMPLSDDKGSLQANINLSYQSRTVLSDTALYDTLSPSQKGYALIDFRLAWNNVMGHPVDATFFVKNLTDKDYRTGSPDIVSAGFGTASAHYGAPRTWGMSLKYRFGASAQQ